MVLVVILYCMKKIIELIESFHNEIKESSQKYVNTKISFPTEFIFVHSIERLKRNLKSILILIKDDPFENDHGIGLAIRNILTDLFVVAYLRDYSKDEDDLTTKAYNLFNDDIDQITRFAKTVSGVGQVPVNAHQDYLNIIATEGTLLNKIKTESKGDFPKTTQIYRDNYLKDADKELHHTIVNAFDMWSYFSKYEHIGFYSYEVTKNPIVGHRKERNILLGLGYAIISAKVSFDMLKEADVLKRLSILDNQCSMLLLENKQRAEQ
jgi:hypothetical protein